MNIRTKAIYVAIRSIIVYIILAVVRVFEGVNLLNPRNLGIFNLLLMS